SSGAQSSCKTIVLLDEFSKTPVPYATVIYLPNSGGTYSNEQGVFKSLLSGSISISHISYQSKTVELTTLTDTIYLQTRDHTLKDVLITVSKNSSKKKYKFSKGLKIIFTLPSFEIGTIISKTNFRINEILIPYKTSAFDNSLRLKLFSVHNGIPDELKHQEVQVVHGSDQLSHQFLRFNSDLTQYENLDSLFISVELMSDIINNGESFYEKENRIILYSHFKNETAHTLTTKNFEVTQRWSLLTSFLNPKRNPPNLTYIIESSQ
ncbi:MAG: hypothetical protein AAF519_12025, partial [Bacteroidota bacterium]